MAVQIRIYTDGDDVLTALTKNELVDKEFSDVDMPHHGSETNHPKEFLDVIKTKNIGVSTDGSTQVVRP